MAEINIEEAAQDVFGVRTAEQPRVEQTEATSINIEEAAQDVLGPPDLGAPIVDNLPNNGKIFHLNEIYFVIIIFRFNRKPELTPCTQYIDQ